MKSWVRNSDGMGHFLPTFSLNATMTALKKGFENISWLDNTEDVKMGSLGFCVTFQINGSYNSSARSLYTVMG